MGQLCLLKEDIYPAKNYSCLRLLKNRMLRYCGGNITGCQQYLTILSLSQPAIRCNTAEQNCTNSRNNVAQTTLLHSVLAVWDFDGEVIRPLTSRVAGLILRKDFAMGLEPVFM